MPNDSSIQRYIQSRDWRIWLGVVVTTAWIIGGGVYVWHVISNNPEALTLEVVGSFLEGAFAPLAFLWLVIGLFIQQRELAENSRALRQTSEQSQKQTQAIAATEMNARQETFFKIKDNVFNQLGAISGMLYASSMGPVGSGEMSREEVDEHFSQVASGDNEIFARRFLTMGFMDEKDLTEMFYGTAIRTGHTNSYVHTFDSLVRLARNCDVDGIIENSLQQSAFGMLHKRMQESAPAGQD